MRNGSVIPATDEEMDVALRSMFASFGAPYPPAGLRLYPDAVVVRRRRKPAFLQPRGRETRALHERAGEPRLGPWSTVAAVLAVIAVLGALLTYRNQPATPPWMPAPASATISASPSVASTPSSSAALVLPGEAVVGDFVWRMTSLATGTDLWSFQRAGAFTFAARASNGGVTILQRARNDTDFAPGGTLPGIEAGDETVVSSIAFDGRRYVAAGSMRRVPVDLIAAPAVWTSTDGFDWKLVELKGPLPAHGAIDEMAYGPGGYLAVAGGRFWQSPDAASWSEVTTVGTQGATFRHVALGSTGYAVAWSAGGGTWIATSRDGRQWSEQQADGDALALIPTPKGFAAELSRPRSDGSGLPRVVVATAGGSGPWTDYENAPVFTACATGVLFCSDVSSQAWYSEDGIAWKSIPMPAWAESYVYGHCPGVLFMEVLQPGGSAVYAVLPR